MSDSFRASSEFADQDECLGPEWDVVDWAKPKNSRGRVRRAGKTFVQSSALVTYDAYEALQTLTTGGPRTATHSTRSKCC
jgi:hypothetical protein